MVKERISGDVRNGGMFIFIGSSCKLMKLLHAENGNMAMCVERLKVGRFTISEYDGNTNSYPMWSRASPRNPPRNSGGCAMSEEKFVHQ